MTGGLLVKLLVGVFLNLCIYLTVIRTFTVVLDRKVGILTTAVLPGVGCIEGDSKDIDPSVHVRAFVN